MKYTIITIFICCFICNSSSAQLETALSLSQSGAFEEAEEVFKTIQEVDKRIMLARAYNYSWWGKHAQAENYFTGILESGDDMDALTGRAYNSLYAGELRLAMDRFKRLKAQEPENKSVQIGLILTYLEKEQFSLAAFHLRDLESNYPEDAEVQYLKGIMYMKNHRFDLAEESFEHSLAIDPAYTPAWNQLRAIPDKGRPWEITPWAGLSDIDGSTTLGMRRLDAFYRLSQNDLLFAYYDNSIRFENHFFSLNDIQAPQVGLGYTHRWNKKWGSGLTVADRLVPDGKNDILFRFEQELFINDELRIEGGLQYDHSASQDLGLYSFAVEKKWNALFSLEISYFYSDAGSNIQDNDRLMLVPKFRLKGGTEIDLGYYSYLFDLPEGRSRAYEGIFATVKQPISNRFDARFLFHNQSQETRELVSTALGLTIKF